MMRFKYIYLIFIYGLPFIFSFLTKENKFIKISYSEEYLIPTISARIKNKNFQIIIDNNLNFNYITTKGFNLNDINFHINDDQINIKDKTYKAYFYIGDISIFDEKNYIHLENLNSFVIDDKSLFSSITISYLLQQLKEELFINKKMFYLDINNKICYFGEILLDSEEYSKIFYSDRFVHTTFYSNNTKGIFKQELKSLYIENNPIQINKLISFFINEYYIIVPYSLLNEISENKLISKLNCILQLIDQKGIYGIKCHKNDISKLPNLYFVFNNNYTFNIPFQLLFEDYDEDSKISLIRNKLKYNKVEKENMDEDEEIIIGYSLIKYLNYSIFSYEDRSVTFYSDKFISDHPPEFLNKIIYFLLCFLVCLLSIATPFLIYIKLKSKYYYRNYMDINIF